jgi:hypothetical protein
MKYVTCVPHNRKFRFVLDLYNMCIIVIFVIGTGSMGICIICLHLLNNYRLSCIEIKVIPSREFIVVLIINIICKDKKMLCYVYLF